MTGSASDPLDWQRHIRNEVLGDEALRTVARDPVKTVPAHVAIDWTPRENVQAHLRVLVKRILRRYGYPPDKQERATETVSE